MWDTRSLPCLVATGLAVADTTILIPVQWQLSLAPWFSGYVDRERCVLLQILVSPSHEAPAESCTQSTLVSYSGLLWFCIHLVSNPLLCHGTTCPSLASDEGGGELSPTQEVNFKLRVFLLWGEYGHGYTEEDSVFFTLPLTPRIRAREKLFKHAKGCNISADDTWWFLYCVASIYHCLFPDSLSSMC